MCDICHHLADSLTQNCAATDAVRDIRTQSARHFLQLCFGKPQTKQAVHAHQNSRTIRTAAGKPCRNGDSFINLNKHTLLYAEGLPHQVCRLPRQIARIRRQPWQVGFQLDYGLFQLLHIDTVIQCYRLHDGFQKMIAVLPFACHIQG